MIDEIVLMLDAAKTGHLSPVRIEIGEKQARTIADELNTGWHVQNRFGLLVNTAPEPISWEQVIQGDGWLFGVRIQGVESPDYLNVVAEATA